MKKLLTMIVILIITIAMVTVFGCKTETVEETAEEEAVEESVEEAEPLYIASAIMNLAWPWFLGTVEGMENKIEELGNIDFTWEDSAFDINTQVQQLENFAQLGVDGVIVYPVDAKAIIPTMVDLSKKGIKIVVCDYPQVTDKDSDIVWETFVGHDFREMGRAAGIIAVDYLKSAGIDNPVCAWVSIPATGQSSIDRFEGFRDVVLKEFPNAEVIEQGDISGSRDSAQSTFENLLQVTPHIDVVSGHNDSVVLGAYGASETQGRDEMKFIGLAGDKEVLGFLKDGNPQWIGEVLQDPVVLGEAAMDAMVRALGGEELDDSYPIPLPEGLTPDTINDYDWQDWEWLGN